LKKRFQWNDYTFWVAADYHLQDNRWRFQTSCDDILVPRWFGGSGGVGAVILTGRELQYHHRWDVRPIPDIYTCLRLKTAVDISTGRTTFFLGFGSVQPVNLKNGITVRHQFPLDQIPITTTTTSPTTTTTTSPTTTTATANNGRHRVMLEVAASLKLPETALEFSTRPRWGRLSSSSSSMPPVEATVSDIHVALDELNLVLDY
jgi:hypothetical protein